MRMWMIKPECMCRQHLLGEHTECHMFYSALRRRTSVSGYLAGNLFEPKSLYSRHEALACEMERRGYNHNSPMPKDIPYEYLIKEEQDVIVDVEAAVRELARRCPLCREKLKDVYRFAI